MNDLATARHEPARRRGRLVSLIALPAVVIVIALAVRYLVDPSPPPTVFDPARVHLICGNDEGAPNELRGCWFDATDGRFGEFGNQVRQLTQPVMAPDRSLIAHAERRDASPVVTLRRPDGSLDLELPLPSFSGPLDWSPDGGALVVVDRAAVVVVDLERSRVEGTASYRRYELPDGQELLGAARFAPAGSMLTAATKEVDRAAGRETYRAVLIDRTSGEVTELDAVDAPLGAGFTGTVADPSFDPAGTAVGWAEGVEGSLRLYGLPDLSIRRYDLAPAASLVTGVSWSPTGLLVVGVDARLQLWDIDGDPPRTTTPLPTDWTITSAAPAWSGDGREFVVTAQVPDTAALLDLVLVDLDDGSLRLLSGSDRPPPPISVFPGFPVWID